MTQDTALAILSTGANVFLTGEPGSGKTYVVNKYIAALRAHGLNVAVTASTGIAATHIGGVTIHSWCGIGIKDYLSKRELEFIADNERLSKKILETHVLIIDEISMLEAKTLEMVDQVLRQVRNSAQPFGGLQVVLVGDFFQLPPITKRQNEQPSFAFEAPAWAEAMFTICYLTEQHRQSDPALSSVLADIRGGDISDATHTHLRTRHVLHHQEKNTATKLFSHNANVDSVNIEKLAELPGEIHSFMMTSHGSKPKIESLIRGCLSPEKLDLKIGAAVMCTRNNPELGFVNGTLGTVIDFDPAEGFPIIRTSAGRVITIEPMEWAIEDGDKIMASVTQVPLRLAWAITVHKSQGMSLDAAMMDLSRSFAYGQGYVALSRVRTLDGIFLLGWNDRALMIDPSIQIQDRILRTHSLAAETDWNGKTLAEQKSLREEFILSNGGRLEPVKQKKHGGPPVTTYHERLDKIRSTYPQAYTPWTEEADATLTEMYRGEVTVKKISTKLGRQPSAIRARLKHLGLRG